MAPDAVVSFFIILVRSSGEVCVIEDADSAALAEINAFEVDYKQEKIIHFA